MQKLNCVRIGNGRVAQCHHEKLNVLGVETLGIIECSVSHKKGGAEDLRVFSSYGEAAKLLPGFWDICTPTESHLSEIKRIIRMSPAANILVEKPVCTLSQTKELRRLLTEFKGKIVVNENYNVSQVTETVRRSVETLRMRPTKVVSEMSKNRTKDIMEGRFLDTEHLAFGYEGTHIITNVLNLGEWYFPAVAGNSQYDDMLLPGKRLAKQGRVEKRYTARNGAEVILYSSMDGRIGHFYPGSCTERIIPAVDGKTRYRVLAVEDARMGATVVGFYEPLKDLTRCVGQVHVFNNGKPVDFYSVADDTMLRAIKSAVGYFQNRSANPCSVERALGVLEMFGLWDKNETSELKRVSQQV